ncbi:MAG: hypothetical protein ABSC37_02375, partial [Xanthobacteraceae bacterium]
GMCVRRSHHRGIGLPRQNEIVSEATATRQQAKILFSPNRFANAGTRTLVNPHSASAACPLDVN